LREKKAGLTQKELAERSGVGVRFIRELEGAKRTARMDKVHQVLAYFGYHLEAVEDYESDRREM
jgi:transcriptional regulator with XRE-family HTH domain